MTYYLDGQLGIAVETYSFLSAKFLSTTMKFMSNNHKELEIVDAIHSQPEQQDSCGRIIPSHFDPVLVKGGEQTGQGGKGM